MTQVTTTIQNLKSSIINYVANVVDANTQGSRTIYEQLSDKIWNEEIAPFVKNENITSWEIDIKKKFIDNPYVAYPISEKQAFCLARAFQQLNIETIK